MAIEIGKIRNVSVVGHGGVGKTSLVEALLFTAGAMTRLGKVDDGSTTTDFDPDEIKRKISINTAVARSEEHTSELQSPYDLVCRLLLEKKKSILTAVRLRGFGGRFAGWF